MAATKGKNELLENFKEAVLVDNIRKVVQSQSLPPAMWGIPSFARNMPSMLCSLIGKKAYDIYTKLNAEEQEQALHHFETAGKAVANELGCPLWEDSPSGGPSKRITLDHLQKNNPSLYQKVQSKK